MPRSVNLLLLVIGIIITVIGLAIATGSSGSPVVLVVGACVLGLALASDYKRSKRTETQRSAESEKRIAELTKVPWQIGQRLVVRSGVGLFFGLSVIGLICLAILNAELAKPTDIKYHFVAFATAFLPIVLIGIVRTGAELFNPALQLSVQGIVTPIHGRIPWSEITGIDLYKQNNKGFISYFLHFRVEQYRKVVKDIHWTEHVLGLIGLGAMRRGYITVRIKDKNEQPETIYAVARFLWKQATNSDYMWSPLLSDATNTAARNIGLTMGVHQDADRLYQRIKSEPQKMLDEMKQMEKDFSVLRKEGARASRQVLWISVILVVLLLLSILWPLLKRL